MAAPLRHCCGVSLRNIVSPLKRSPLSSQVSAISSASASPKKEENLPAKRGDWVVEKTTHTGQRWAKDDYRLARFMKAGKEINKQFAIDLIAKVPPKKVHERVVWCDGGDPHLGHPKVYINLDQPGPHTCGYCGLRYEKE